MSDDSDDDVTLELKNYLRKYQMILERCEVLQQDNERLINRVQHVHNYLRIAQKEHNAAMERLQSPHQDDWKPVVMKSLAEYLQDVDKKERDAKAKGFRRPPPTRRPGEKHKVYKRRAPKEQKPIKPEPEPEKF